MTNIYVDAYKLIKNPIFILLITSDGVNPNEVFNMMLTTRPVIGGKRAPDWITPGSATHCDPESGLAL